jgi:TDG/mug DNA glycosylase family protein
VGEKDHRIAEDWLGEEVETLEDLLRPGLLAVCVGINPSPVSVEVGHYYQGRLGKLFFARLQEAGLIDSAASGREDDVAFESGVGFTDIVKRPTARADDLTKEDYSHGKDQLLAKLNQFQPGLIIFTFKKSATVLYGRFEGSGFVDGLTVGAVPAFVMPGPYEKKARVSQALEELREHAGS